MSLEEFNNLKIGDKIKDGYKSIVYQIDRDKEIDYTKNIDNSYYRNSFGHYKFFESPIKTHCFTL